MSIMDGFASIGRALADMFSSRVEEPRRYETKVPSLKHYADMLREIREEQQRYSYYIAGEPVELHPESFCGVCGITRYSLPDDSGRTVIGPAKNCDHCLSWLRGVK